MNTPQNNAGPPFIYAPGDRVPDFFLPDPNGAMTGLMTHSRGNPIVFIIASGDLQVELRPFVAAFDDGKYSSADVFAITRQQPYENGLLAEALQIHFAILADERGEVSQTLARAAMEPTPPPKLATLLLAPD